jgi:hypothetical protein
MFGEEVPGVVKRLTVADFFRLSHLADNAGLHAFGSPDWIAERRLSIKYIFAHPLLWKTVASGAVLRCYVGVVEPLGLSAFTMDIPTEEFMALDDVSDVWELSEVVLTHARFVNPSEA